MKTKVIFLYGLHKKCGVLFLYLDLDLEEIKVEIEDFMGKLKVLLTNASGVVEHFEKDYNKIKGYMLMPPISLTTIAATALKKVDGVEIEILDLELELRKHFMENDKSSLSPMDLLKNKIIDKMDEFQPDLVGISVVFSPAHNNALAIANIVKEKNPTTKVICGGNHATFAYKRMLEKCSNLDFVFLYEADDTFPLFLKYLKGEIKFEDLKGVAWWNKTVNKVNITPNAPLIHELDPLPIPEWNLVPIKKYQNYGRVGAMHRFGDGNAPSYVMQTARGCVASCTFCSVRSFYGKGVRSYSARRVLEEIDYLYNDLGIQQLEIVDDDFTHSRERTLEICNGLIKRNYNLIWNVQNGIRLGTINEEVMHAMVLAKCRTVSIGVESGNDTTLAIVRKPLTIKMLYEKSEIFQKYPELYVKGNYIVGFPFETEEQTMNTFKVAEDIGFDWNQFSVFRPLPGTPLFESLDKTSQENLIDKQKDFSVAYGNARKSRNKIAEKMQSSLIDPEEAAKYGDKIEEQMKEALMHGEDDEHLKNNAPKDEKIDELSYIKNLEINFIKNKNLLGASVDKYIETKKGNKKGKYHFKINKPQNLDRAINDFEGIANMREKNHAIAHYCLAKAYRLKDKDQIAQKHVNKVIDILANPLNKIWVEYFDKVVPKNELNDLRHLMN